MHKAAMISGTLFAGSAVLLGAFGAHALKEKLGTDQLQIFETAVRYQMYHAIALLLLGISVDKLNSQLAGISVWLFVTGIILFSGSLILLACKTLAGIEHWKFLGPVTPLGGLCFIGGWILFLFAYLKK